MNFLRTFAAKIARAAGIATVPVGRPLEQANQSATATASKIQGAIRAAEQGDTLALFTLYRDMMFDNHVQAELQKRKLAVLNQPWSLLPNDDANPADQAAVEAVDEMISHCAAWSDGLAHLLDATVWPLTVAEKIYRPGTDGLRYELAELAPVNPALMCFRRPDPLPPVTQWERDLRIYPMDEKGVVQRDVARATPLDPARHLVHRGHLMTGQRDFFGGPLRGVLPWWFLRVSARDWFGRTMERFGTPFILGKVDSSNTAAVDFLQEQFDTAKKIGGLVVDESTIVELKEIALSGTADAHERFGAVCNREISLLIVGQTLSAQAQPTGLGSGTADLQAAVRADLRAWDMLRLGETLREQLFRPFLLINGLTGEPPRISWGGDDPAARTGLADLLVKVNQAGLEPADDALPVLSEKLGFNVQRKAAPASPIGSGGDPNVVFDPSKDIVAQRLLWRESLKKAEAEANAQAAAAPAPVPMSAARIAFKADDGRWVTINGEHVLLAGDGSGSGGSGGSKSGGGMDSSGGGGSGKITASGKDSGDAPKGVNTHSRKAPVSGHVTLPSDDAVRAPAERALSAINKVHDDGDLMLARPIPIEKADGGKRSEAGTYEFNGFVSQRITAGGAADDAPELTVTHEMGHMLHHQGFGWGEGKSSAAELQAYTDAARKTVAGKELAAAARRAQGKSDPVSKHLRYLADPKEQFARDYSHYIALRSGDEKMLGAIKAERGRTAQFGHLAYKSDADFEPVAASFDKVFAKKGWR